MLVAELADDVEGFARRLLEGQAQLVLGNGALDLRSHVRGHLEETVGRHESVECLVWTLEVVVADEVLDSPLRVDDVREHRASHKLVPQRLPETLHLAQRLRMLRSAPNVLNAEPLEVLHELRLAAPHRVLPTVVGQHLGRCPVRRHATLEGLHHERGLLMVRQ